jgi:hypothetical protein
VGTSTSHASPAGLNWQATQTAYLSKDVPVERFVGEVWRACQGEDEHMSSLLESSLIFECYETVRTSTGLEPAMEAMSRQIAKSKQSTIVSDLARRATVLAFGTPTPEAEWRVALFTQVTDYLISRDLPGFVGSRYRNRSVEEAIGFKDEAIRRVRERVQVVPLRPRSAQEWRAYVRDVMRSLVGRR